MRTYRIVGPNGSELATVEASNVVEVIATRSAAVVPLESRIVVANGSATIARRELWPGDCPAWSLVSPSCP